MSRMRMNLCLAVAAMLFVAFASLASAMGQKPGIPVVDPDGNPVGVAKIKAECAGECASLEVEVELYDAMPYASCTAYVMPQFGDLPDFVTDDQGAGETKADLPLRGEPGDEVELTVVVLCDGVRLTATTKVIVPDCGDD